MSQLALEFDRRAETCPCGRDAVVWTRQHGARCAECYLDCRAGVEADATIEVYVLDDHGTPTPAWVEKLDLAAWVDAEEARR